MLVVDDAPSLRRCARLMLGQGDQVGQVQMRRELHAQVRFDRAHRMQPLPGNPGLPVRVVSTAVHAHA